MVVYRLRPEARFHDGKAMTPEDVIWSMQALRDANPFYNAYYKNITKAEQTGDHEVTFTFSQKGNRELPLITGQLPVLPKHWWTGKDSQGQTARHQGDDTRSAARLRRLCGNRGEARRLAQDETRRRLLGQGLAGEPRAGQFRRDRIHLLPRCQCGVRSLQGRSVRLAARDLLQDAGPPATIFPPSRTAGWSRKRFT